MWAAIQKYGWKSFKHDVIVSNLTQEEANIFEMNFITLFNSADRRYGYNIQEGGRSAGGMSPEALKAMADGKRGDKAPNARAVAVFDLQGNRIATFSCTVYAAANYGIKRSTLLTHLSKGRGTCGGYSFRYVDVVGDMQHLPLSEIFTPGAHPKARGGLNRRAVSVNVYELNGTFIQSFGSIGEAAQFLNVGRGTLNECLNFPKRTCKGKLVRRASECNGTLNLPLNSPVKVRDMSAKKIPIVQYTMSGAFVARFDSVTDAAAELRLNARNIYSCLYGNAHHSCGYQWRYDTGDYSDIGPAITQADVRRANRSYSYKPIWSIDPRTGERVQWYESTHDASRKLKADRSGIMNVLRGRKKTCHGYGWEYDV